MQLANFMNEITAIEVEDLLARLSHKANFARLEAEIRAARHARAARFWFCTETFTTYVYGNVLPLATRGLSREALPAVDFIRGVLLNFACREAEVGSYVVQVGALHPSDIGFVDFHKNSANFVFCEHPAPPPAQVRPDRSVRAAGNLLFDVKPAALATLLPRDSISTLFFDLTEDPEEQLQLLHELAPRLAANATLIAQGPSPRLHGLFSRLTHHGAAKLWAQCVVRKDAESGVREDAESGVREGADSKITFAYFELLDRAALHRARANPSRILANVARVEPPMPASPGPYHYVDSPEVHAHATTTFEFASERIVPFRQPLFVHGAENADAIWRGQFGMLAQDWLYLDEMRCPPLRCSVFDKVRIVGTETMFTEQDFMFTASQHAMSPTQFKSWSPVFNPDLREVSGGFACERASRIGQHVRAPTLLMSNSGLPMHYHFLFDVLPRLWFLQHPALSNYNICLPTTVRPYQIEALTRYYGIDADRIHIFSPHGDACLFDRACAAPSLVSDWWAMPEAILAPRAALRHAVPPREAKYRNAKRIYVSRRDVADHRSLVNETELVERLTRLGFIEIFPSTFPYDEEMFMFQNADVVVGPFGSGMANLVFCAPGAKIVLLQPDSTNWRVLSFVMHALGLDYGYVFGEAFRKRSRGHNTEWIIDVDAVAARLATLL